jgi:hypothetical protein
MRNSLAIAFFALLLAAPQVSASTVVLTPGESFTSGDTNVVCVPDGSNTPLTRTECQYWDEFNKRCLYQRKIVTYGDIQCVEECQHWDDFKNECRFATRCVFHHGQRRFVRTACEEFDAFNATCLRTRQELIGTTRER